MSTLASIQSFAGLGAAAGRGEAFLNRFAQGQELVGQELRRQQIGEQVRQAELDREVRLREISAQQESRAFSDILQAESAMREASQESRTQALREREAELDLAEREERLNDRFRRREAISQLPEEVQRLAAAGFTNAATQMLKTEEKDVDKEIAKNIKLVGDVQRAMSDPNLTDEQIQQLQGALDQGISAIQDLSQRKLQAKDTIQKSQPVKRGDAGPALSTALDQADQSAPLPLPLTDASLINTDQLVRDKVYQTPDGPMIWRGDGFDPVDEVPQTRLQGGGQPTLLNALQSMGRGGSLGVGGF